MAAGSVPCGGEGGGGGERGAICRSPPGLTLQGYFLCVQSETGHFLTVLPDPWWWGEGGLFLVLHLNSPYLFLSLPSSGVSPRWTFPFSQPGVAARPRRPQELRRRCRCRRSQVPSALCRRRGRAQGCRRGGGPASPLLPTPVGDACGAGSWREAVFPQLGCRLGMGECFGCSCRSLSHTASPAVCWAHCAYTVSHPIRLLTRDLKYCEKLLCFAGALPKVLQA